MKIWILVHWWSMGVESSDNMYSGGQSWLQGPHTVLDVFVIQWT